MSYPTLTYYPIESGKEDETPRTIHAWGTLERTKCGLVTLNCVSIVRDEDKDCEECYPPDETS